MKIAGRKNDGAWARTNLFLADANAELKAGLVVLIAGMNTLNAGFEALTGLQQDCGVLTTELPTDALAWATTLVNAGIPRQIWMGTLSFDVYQEHTNPAGKKVYTKKYEPAIRAMSIELRYTVTRFIYGIRAVKDLTNKRLRSEGNPSGQPDANKAT